MTAKGNTVSPCVSSGLKSRRDALRTSSQTFRILSSTLKISRICTTWGGMRKTHSGTLNILCASKYSIQKNEYIMQKICARAILHNFSSAIISGVGIGRRRTKYEYQVNFAEAFKICRDFLRIYDKTAKMEVESLIAQNIEPVRFISNIHYMTSTVPN